MNAIERQRKLEDLRVAAHAVRAKAHTIGGESPNQDVQDLADELAALALLVCELALLAQEGGAS